MIVDWTRRRVNRLSTGYRRRDPATIADLARIRRCADGKPHTDPETLAWTLDGLPRNPNVEWAGALALGLYATAQSSIRNHDMQDDDTPFMTAVRTMRDRNNGWANGIDGKIRFINATDQPDLLASRLRALTRMLNQTHTPCDWGWLAYWLAQWADPDRRDSARIRWGRDYTTVAGDDKTDSNND